MDAPPAESMTTTTMTTRPATVTRVVDAADNLMCAIDDLTALEASIVQHAGRHSLGHYADLLRALVHVRDNIAPLLEGETERAEEEAANTPPPVHGPAPYVFARARTWCGNSEWSSEYGEVTCPDCLAAIDAAAQAGMARGLTTPGGRDE